MSPPPETPTFRCGECAAFEARRKQCRLHPPTMLITVETETYLNAPARKVSRIQTCFPTMAPDDWCLDYVKPKPVDTDE